MKAWQLTTGLALLAVAVGQLGQNVADDAPAVRARLDRVVGTVDYGFVGPEELPPFSEEGVDSAMRGRRDLQECFFDGQQPWDTFVGDFDVRFRVLPDGRVESAELDNPALRDHPLGRCVSKAIESLRFAPFSGGGVWVSYRFKF